VRTILLDGSDSSQPLNEKIQRRINDQKSSGTGDIEQHRKESHVRQRNGIGSVTRLEKATMIATIHNEPEFSELFMSYLLTRNSRIEEDLVDQLFNSSEKRLARLLLLLANFGKEGRPEPIVGKFSQETLAEMIGKRAAKNSFMAKCVREQG
jgi:hypothetical protein